MVEMSKTHAEIISSVNIVSDKHLSYRKTHPCFAFSAAFHLVLLPLASALIYVFFLS